MPTACIITSVIFALALAYAAYSAFVTRRAFREWREYGRAADAECVRLRQQISVLGNARWVYRDIWDHLPEYLPMSDDRRRLAWEIGIASPTIEPSSTGPRVRLEDRAWLTGHPSNIDRFVRKVDDPVLNRLWEERSFWSIHEMLRVLLFQVWHPAFDGRSGFAALRDEPPGTRMYLGLPLNASPSATPAAKRSAAGAAPGQIRVVVLAPDGATTGSFALTRGEWDAGEGSGIGEQVQEAVAAAMQQLPTPEPTNQEGDS